MKRRTLLASGALAATACLATNLAHAQDFPPKKAVTLVVGFAAGGSADIAARVIAKKLGENIGQSVIVENKPGAAEDQNVARNSQTATLHVRLTGRVGVHVV